MDGQLADLIMQGVVGNPGALVMLDADFRVVFANDSALRIWGYGNRDQVVGRHSLGFWKDGEESRAFIDAVVRHGLWSGELIAVGSDGAEIDLYVNANAIRDAEGRVVGILGMFFDISVQRNELRQLEAKRRIFSFISERAKLVVWECVPEEGYFRVIGDTPIFPLPRDPATLSSLEARLGMYRPADRARLIAGINEVVNGGGRFGPIEGMAILPDGTEIWVETDGYLATPLGETPARLVGWSRDVTERKSQEARMVHAQRIETLGQLAGGVAHDFNNLLMGLQLNVELLQERISKDARSSEYIETALQAIGRGAELTHRLLAFSREQALRPEVLDLRDAVERIKRLLVRTLGADVQVVTIVPPDVWRVRVDPGQLENAVLNLALNARDAMPRGGVLTIEAGNCQQVGDGSGSDEPSTLGECVRLSVRDTGTGMLPDVAARAFEPFFTTKEVGKGSGLGLSMVYGLVKQSNGHIELDSAPGVGTVVALYFPRAIDPTERRKTVDQPRDLPRGQETLLVVEDEPTVRHSLVKILQSLGYEVYSAGDGPSALRLIDEFEIRPRLVLSDVVLPNGMSGPEVVDAVLKRVDGCVALMMSGYTERHPELFDKLDADRIDLLHKPYTRHTLAGKIREALSR